MRFPNTFALLFYFLIGACLLTWLLPAGSFEREVLTVNGVDRTVLITGSYKPVQSNPQSWQVFSAFSEGFVRQAEIIAFILIVGGAFSLLQATGAVEKGIHDFISWTRRLDSKGGILGIPVEYVVLALIMLVFSTFGAVYGMSEETIPFVLIFVPLAERMGFDRFVGVSMCFVGAGLGFAGAFLNPFTLGVAQGIAQITPFTGFGYRLFCFFVISVVGISYVLRYAYKTRTQPGNQSETVAFQDRDEPSSRKKILYLSLGMTLIFIALAFRHPLVGFELPGIALRMPLLGVSAVLFPISTLLFNRKSISIFILKLLTWVVIWIIIGVMALDWYILEIAALFFAFGIMVGIAKGYEGNTLVDKFLEGVKEITPAALVVALAGGIIILLEHGRVIDTLLFYLAQTMSGIEGYVGLNLMFLFQSVLNIFVPSGSGQAALTMPLMAPLSDLMGISRQAAVLAYQFGDGFTNLITPTSGILIGVLGLAKIPYAAWFRFMIPLQILLLLTGFFLLSLVFWVEPTGFTLVN